MVIKGISMKKHLSTFALWNIFLLLLMAFFYIFLSYVLTSAGLSDSAYIYLGPILSCTILEVILFRVFFRARKKKLILASYFMLLPIITVMLFGLGGIITFVNALNC